MMYTDAEVLGRLLLMQTVINSLPDNSIMKFVLTGLKDLPGIEEVRYVPADGEMPDPQVKSFVLTTGKASHGELLIFISNKAAFEQYEVFLKNFVFMLSVILEERKQRAVIESYKLQLEERINERTKELQREVSERAKAEENLRRIEERLRLALHAANQGLFEIDFSDDKISVIPEYESMLGYKPQTLALTIEKWSALLHPDDREKALGKLESCKNGDKSEFEIEYRMKTDSGDWKWILAIGKVVSFDDGKPLRLSGTHTDISGLKDYQSRLEKYARELSVANSNLSSINQELNQANGQLKELDNLKSEFVSLASHELKTPLTSIVGYAQTLLAEDVKVDSTAQTHYLKVIEKEGLRLSHLISDLLDLSKMESGESALNRSQFDLEELIHDQLSKLNVLHKVNIVTSISLSRPVMVYADRKRIGQLLNCLIENALRHTCAQGTVSFSIHKTRSNCLEVVISDSGRGIPEEDLPKIFDRFYRVRKETAQKSEGSGLGLSIAKEIVSAHHGTIWAESSKTGTDFHFTLPYDKIG